MLAGNARAHGGRWSQADRDAAAKMVPARERAMPARKREACAGMKALIEADIAPRQTAQLQLRQMESAASAEPEQRELIQDCDAMVSCGALGAPKETLARWSDWALREANKAGTSSSVVFDRCEASDKRNNGDRSGPPTTLRELTLAAAPRDLHLSDADQRQIQLISEQARTGNIAPYPMNTHNGEHTEWQAEHMAARSVGDLDRLWHRRRMAVFQHLSDTYMRARCATLRRWMWLLGARYKRQPWMTHWPAVHEYDQHAMLDFVTDASIRYKDHGAAVAARVHVEQFHLDHGWAPPKFPLVDHFLGRKLKKLLKAEHPDGRKIQGAFTPAEFSVHCAQLRQERDQEAERGNKWAAADKHEMLMAFCAIYEVAGRTGNYCRGAAFEAGSKQWTKATFWSLTHCDARLDGATAIQLPQPPLKTSEHTSAAAAQRTREPAVYILTSTKEYSFAQAAGEEEHFRMYDEATAAELPPFMKNTRSRIALSERDVADEITRLEKINQTQIVASAIGTKLLRRGRTQALEFAAFKGYGRVQSRHPGGGAGDTINSITTHTSDTGRAPYSSTPLEAKVRIQMAADDAIYEAGTDAYQFRGYSGGVPELVTVREREDGSMISVKEPAATLALPACRPTAPAQRKAPPRKAKQTTRIYVDPAVGEYNATNVDAAIDDDRRSLAGVVQVRTAPGKGKGVFACRSLEPATYVGTYYGTVLELEQFNALYGPDNPAVYAMRGHADRIIDAGDTHTSLTRNYNHAPGGVANCEISDRHVWPQIYTVTTINDNEELTIDYGSGFFETSGGRSLVPHRGFRHDGTTWSSRKWQRTASTLLRLRHLPKCQHCETLGLKDYQCHHNAMDCERQHADKDVALPPFIACLHFRCRLGLDKNIVGIIMQFYNVCDDGWGSDPKHPELCPLPTIIQPRPQASDVPTSPNDSPPEQSTPTPPASTHNATRLVKTTAVSKATRRHMARTGGLTRLHIEHRDYDCDPIWTTDAVDSQAEAHVRSSAAQEALQQEATEQPLPQHKQIGSVDAANIIEAPRIRLGTDMRTCVMCPKPAAPGICPKTTKPKKACSQECFDKWRQSNSLSYQLWRAGEEVRKQRALKRAHEEAVAAGTEKAKPSRLKRRRADTTPAEDEPATDLDQALSAALDDAEDFLDIEPHTVAQTSPAAMTRLHSEEKTTKQTQRS